jgi:hypothetical protein
MLKGYQYPAVAPDTRPASETSWLAVSRSPHTLARPILAVSANSSSSKKLEDHDSRVPIFGMGREVAVFGGIRILMIATTNRHDLPRTVLLAPLLDQVNCAGKLADERCGDHSAGSLVLSVLSPQVIRYASPPSHEGFLECL